MSMDFETAFQDNAFDAFGFQIAEEVEQLDQYYTKYIFATKHLHWQTEDKWTRKKRKRVPKYTPNLTENTPKDYTEYNQELLLIVATIAEVLANG